MHYPKVLERVDFPEQIFHRSFSLGAPTSWTPKHLLEGMRETKLLSMEITLFRIQIIC